MLIVMPLQDKKTNETAVDWAICREVLIRTGSKVGRPVVTRLKLMKLNLVKESIIVGI